MEEGYIILRRTYLFVWELDSMINSWVFGWDNYVRHAEEDEGTWLVVEFEEDERANMLKNTYVLVWEA